MIIDTHAHYDDEQFDTDREELLDSMEAGGIGLIVNAGSTVESWDKIVRLTDRYLFLYGAIGVHPDEAGSLDEEKFSRMSDLLDLDKIVAVGEIGLDYYWQEPDREIQREWFARQLALAREVKLPVIIHSREAAQETVDIMKAENSQEIGGVIHCYSYSKELARTFLDMGFYFGIGGVLTFKNARKLKEAVEYIPLDRIVVETDCPYLAPEPNRGKRNSSLNLPYVITRLAELKGLEEEEIREAVWRNAHALYRL